MCSRTPADVANEEAFQERLESKDRYIKVISRERMIFVPNKVILPGEEDVWDHGMIYTYIYIRGYEIFAQKLEHDIVVLKKKIEVDGKLAKQAAASSKAAKDLERMNLQQVRERKG